jgi:hypothetical protein
MLRFFSLTFSILCLAFLVVVLSRRPEPLGPVPADGVHLSHTSERGYHLVRNGEPFFIRGAAGGHHLGSLSAAGANTVRVYDPERLPALLDSAQAVGLAVIADIPLPKSYPRHPHFIGYDSVEQVLDYVLPIVRRHRDHPALLAWMLGNEIFETDYTHSFLTAYNRLVDSIRAEDPHHPVSTALIRRQLGEMRLEYREPAVDFLSINMFGNLNNFELYKAIYFPVWRGPYLISEWGQDGYWEADLTAWKAPVEPSSHHAARFLSERYRARKASLHAARSLGHLVFYWGHKLERTPSWFSFFTAAGRPTEKRSVMTEVWTGRQQPFPGIQLDYILIDDHGPRDDLILTAGDSASAVVYSTNEVGEDAGAVWEIRREYWNEYDENEPAYGPIPTQWVRLTPTAAQFVVPSVPGPYRLHYSVTDSSGYAATVTFPFYVLADPDA